MARPLRSAPVTGASPLLRDGPPPCPGPVLCLSRFLPLEELPPPRALRHGDPRATGSPVPRKSLDRARALFTPDAAGAADRYPPGSSQDRIHSPGSDITLSISTLPQGFGFTRLHDPHLTRSCRAFSATLTTPALNRRSSRWFAASSCKAAAEGLPPSLTQHRQLAERTYAICRLPFRTHVRRGFSEERHFRFQLAVAALELPHPLVIRHSFRERVPGTLLPVCFHPKAEGGVIYFEFPRYLGDRQGVIDYLPGSLLLELRSVSFRFSRHSFPSFPGENPTGSPVRKRWGTSRAGRARRAAARHRPQSAARLAQPVPCTQARADHLSGSHPRDRPAGDAAPTRADPHRPAPRAHRPGGPSDDQADRGTDRHPRSPQPRDTAAAAC